MSESLAPLILTLKLDRETFIYFDRLRQKYFPTEKNFLPAHVTLFHALPGEEASEIQQRLQDYCSRTSIFTLTFPKLRFLGRGVAVEIDSPPLTQLRQHLAKSWHDWLSHQDRQGYRPHITITNKTTAERSRQLYEQMTNDWQAFEGYGEGLLLWYYLGGPWKLLDEFVFRP
ncbi:MAG: 2'-5' RNA ligase family protein [Cyanosarcina radialis HA8281-LM2]|jgi:2'-5' RNA ligase|nr:2'-5' RNA ligase family protein [Cyanosarcina radialis HA8281-LM2]